MKLSRLNWVSLCLALFTFGIAWWFYPQLPDPVPTHWNASGEVDGWIAKPWGVYLLPLINTGTAVLLMILPVISPKGFRLDSARRAYDIVIFIFVGFLSLISVFSWRSGAGGDANLVEFVPMLIGFLFIALGNYLGKFPKNFFVGIRTPWTLASDEVWNRTHRLAGWLFMAAGAITVASGFFDTPDWVFVTAVATAAVVPAVYSLVLYKKLEGFGSDEA